VGWNSSAGTATPTGWTVQRPSPGRDKISAPFRSDPGAHPASYKMGTGSFLGVNRPGRGDDHPSSPTHGHWAGIAQPVQRLAKGWTVQGPSPGRDKISAPFRSDPGAHPASYKMGTGSFLGVNRPGRGDDHPSSPTHGQWAWIAQPVQRLATGWTVQGSSPGRDEIFCTLPKRPWGPPSLL